MISNRRSSWVALLTLASVAAAQDTVTLYASSIPDASGWLNPSRALGAPNSNGNDDQYAKTADGNITQYLAATAFQSFTLPPARVITGVWIDTLCRFDSGTTGNRIRLRVGGSVPTTVRTSSTWNQTNTALGWRMGGTGWDITALRSSWTAAEIAGLEVGLRRDLGTSILRCDGFRIVVQHESDADSDGIPDRLDACPLDPANDADHDGLCANSDNCPTFFNPDQIDLDADGIGDACDPCIDPDRDGRCNGADNCPTVANPDQSDLDTDGIGDACDPDRDGDGLPNTTDPCPDDPHPNDADNDGVCDTIDNCPVLNPDQSDVDGDGIGDACDTCAYPNRGIDDDHDGIDRACDPDEMLWYTGGSNTNLLCYISLRHDTGVGIDRLNLAGQVISTGYRTSGSTGGQTGGGLGGDIVTGSAGLQISLTARRITAYASARAFVGPGAGGLSSAQATAGGLLVAELAGSSFFRLDVSGVGVSMSLPPLAAARRLGPGFIHVRTEPFAESVAGAAAQSGSLLFELLPHDPACTADLNFDHVVDDADFVIFSRAYDDFMVPPAADVADQDRDGFVADNDFVIFAAQYDAFACPP